MHCMRSLRRHDAGPHVWPSHMWLTGLVRTDMRAHALPPSRWAAATRSVSLEPAPGAAGAGDQPHQLLRVDPDAVHTLAQDPASVHTSYHAASHLHCLAFYWQGAEAAIEAVGDVGAESTEALISASRLIQSGAGANATGGSANATATDPARCTLSRQQAPLTASEPAPSTARMTRSGTRAAPRCQVPHGAL